jgi:hypothetical protein
MMRNRSVSSVYRDMTRLDIAMALHWNILYCHGQPVHPGPMTPAEAEAVRAEQARRRRVSPA